MKKWFTVMLLYPDWADDFPQTYTACVKARGRNEALKLARRECKEENGGDEEDHGMFAGCDDSELEDKLAEVAVMKGRVQFV